MNLGHELWRASWQGGLFILGVFAVCRVFRRIPANGRYWLWWLACLQLPVRLLFLNPVAIPVLPAPPTPVVAASAQPALAESDVSYSSEVDGSSSQTANSAEPIATVPETVKPPFPIQRSEGPDLWLVAWGVGVLAMTAYGALLVRRSRLLLRYSDPIVSAPVLELLAVLSEELRVRQPEVRQASTAQCPMLVGWFRPVIVVPVAFESNLSHADLKMALAHELAHLRRRDLWLATVPVLTQTLFFFHPLAWLAGRETSAACEEVCDIEAMRITGGSPSAYARLLIRYAQSGPNVAAVGAALGFHLLKRRITMLRQSKLSTNLAARRSVTALLAIAVVCAIPWKVTAQTAASVSTTALPAGRQEVLVTPAAEELMAAHRAVTITPAHAAKPTKAQIAHHLRALKKLAAMKKANPSVVYWTTPEGKSVATLAEEHMAVPPARAQSIAATVALPPTRSQESATISDSVLLPPHQGGGGGLSINAPDYVNQARRLDNGQISFDFQGVDVGAALRAVLKASDMNFSIKSDIGRERVTCFMKNGSIEEALRIIFGSTERKLEYRRGEDGNTLFIGAAANQ